MRGADLSYPEWLLGEWKVSSELASVETPQGDALAGEAAVRARAKVKTNASLADYTKRFVRLGDKIVNDRASTSQPLLTSLGSEGPAESAEWGGAENPDVAVLRLKRGSFTVRLNLRSGLKAGAVPEGRPDLFNVSELFLAATEAPAEVVPLREVTKFKRVDQLPGKRGRGVEELLRVEVYPALPADAGANTVEMAGDQDKPVAIYKYRCILVPASS